MNFAEYSRYYDLLYHDKNYEAESAYICELLKRFAPDKLNCLEVGAGTGRHGLLLAEQGYHVHGIEQSPDMLSEAQKRLAETKINSGSFNVSLGDARTFNLKHHFPIAISLFHVFSYMRKDEDVDAMLSNVARHLEIGGVFIFDLWYSPAVYHFRPSVRAKRAENDSLRLVRLCEPIEVPNENVVEVNYELYATNKSNGAVKVVREQHPMRHFSLPEVTRVCKQFGLVIEHAEEWMTKAPPSEKTWGVCLVARKSS